MSFVGLNDSRKIKVDHLESEQTRYMEQALDQAMARRGYCAPNPAVGAVLVRDQALLATGTHWASGLAHAEVDALSKVSAAEARGATLYVTLEPCCHWGKTPPCTQAIIDAGIARVYYGFLDPNPEVAGQGVQQLREAGIECEPCFLPSIREFYASYVFWHEHAEPFVTAKLAVSCDSKIAGLAGKPIQLTGSRLHTLTHEFRQKSDAILTTVKTVLNDDPQLNVRLKGSLEKKPVYVLDTHLRFPLKAKLFDTSERLIVFHAPEASPIARERLVARGVSCIAVSTTGSQLSLTEVLRAIGQDGMHDLWVEAGGMCFESFWKAGLLQRALIYIAPIVVGEEGVGTPFRLLDLPSAAKRVEWQVYGDDLACDMLF